MKWSPQTMLAAAVLAAISCPLQAQQQQPPQGQQPPAQSPALQQLQQQQQQQQQPEPEAVAKVNGSVITKPELEARAQARLNELNQQAQREGKALPPQVAQQVQKQTLDTLIESRLIEQHATSEGPAVDPREVESAVDRVKQQLSSQQVEFNQFLATRGYTEDTFRKRIEGSIAWQKYQQERLNEENLRDFFEQNADQFQATSFEEAPQQQVVQSYTTSMWDDIVNQLKPGAEIEVVQSGGPEAPGQRPQQQQQAPGSGGFPQ